MYSVICKEHHHNHMAKNHVCSCFVCDLSLDDLRNERIDHSETKENQRLISVRKQLSKKLTHKGSRKRTRDKMPIWSTLPFDICSAYLRSWCWSDHKDQGRSWRDDAGTGEHDNQWVEHWPEGRTTPQQTGKGRWKRHVGNTQEGPEDSRSYTDQWDSCSPF